MLKYIIICLCCIYIISGCASNNAKRGTYVGGYTGALGGIIGKGDMRTIAIASGIGAVAGYIIGNEMDKQQSPLYYSVKPGENGFFSTIPKQSYHNNHIYMNKSPNIDHIYINNQPNRNERTDCKKITKKRIFSDGSHEVTIEEVCEGRRTTDTY